MPKVLIVHPDFQRLGGIETYFIKLFPHLGGCDLSFSIARRPQEKTILHRLKRILADYLRFWKILADRDITLVHLNPSLNARSFLREELFFRMAKLRGKKVLVFFHGWSSAYEARLDRSGGRLFRWLYGGADAFVVLAKEFADKIGLWGVHRPVYCETTIIEDRLIDELDLPTVLQQRLGDPEWKLVLASRLMATKGIGTSIKALDIIQRRFPATRLIIAGDGEYGERARMLARELNVEHVEFVGRIEPDAMQEIYLHSHLLLFPTEHDEGFPNLVVEAMAFGLPVVTRPVGGIADFFQQGVHGYTSSDTDAKTFARLVLEILEDPARYRQIAIGNHDYAGEHFRASRAARRMLSIYAQVDPVGFGKQEGHHRDEQPAL